jgi:hypothetical protein
LPALAAVWGLVCVTQAAVGVVATHSATRVWAAAGRPNEAVATASSKAALVECVGWGMEKVINEAV